MRQHEHNSTYTHHTTHGIDYNGRKDLLLHIVEVNGQLCRVVMEVDINGQFRRFMVMRRRRRNAVSSI